MHSNLPPHAFQYEACDIPVGQTIADWSRINRPRRKRGKIARLCGL